jgi:hypothetical protein
MKKNFTSQDRVTVVDTQRATTGRSHRLGRSGFVSVAFSPDGRPHVATNAIGGASVLDLTAANPTPERVPGTNEDINVVAFSPDGHLAAAGPNGTVQFRDPRTFEPLGAPVTVGTGVTLTLVFSPDSRLLAGSTPPTGRGSDRRPEPHAGRAARVPAQRRGPTPDVPALSRLTEHVPVGSPLSRQDRPSPMRLHLTLDVSARVGPRADESDGWLTQRQNRVTSGSK